MPRTDELAAAAATAFADLVLTIRNADHPAMTPALLAVLNTATALARSLDERPADAALRRAIARLP